MSDKWEELRFERVKDGQRRTQQIEADKCPDDQEVKGINGIGGIRSIDRLKVRSFNSSRPSGNEVR